MILRGLLNGLLLLLLPSMAYASGGFTWVSTLAHHYEIHLPEHVLTFILVGVVLLVLGVLYRAKLNRVENIVIPDDGVTLRNIFESYAEFMMGQCRAVIGEKLGPKYFNFIATIFLVILTSNLIGLIPGFLPPTGHLSTTLALGLFSFIYYNMKGCKELGVVNYLKHFAGPLWYMAILIFPIEILSNCIRPMSLALRLKGNMDADHRVLAIFSDLVPVGVPIIFLCLGLLVCVVQAYVFTVLSMVYISLATANHDHDDHH